MTTYFAYLAFVFVVVVFEMDSRPIGSRRWSRSWQSSEVLCEDHFDQLPLSLIASSDARIETYAFGCHESPEAIANTLIAKNLVTVCSLISDNNEEQCVSSINDWPFQWKSSQIERSARRLSNGYSATKWNASSFPVDVWFIQHAKEMLIKLWMMQDACRLIHLQSSSGTHEHDSIEMLVVSSFCTCYAACTWESNGIFGVLQCK